MILEHGEHTVNVHMEHKNNWKRRAGGTVAIVTKPENKRFTLSFFRSAESMIIRPSLSGIYSVTSGGGSRVTTRPSVGYDLRFKLTFRCLVSGPSGSGKSSICIRFLQNLNALCTEPNFSSGIIWCYSKSSAIPYRHSAGKKHVRFHERVRAD